jgi:hypothetical protein
MPAAAIEPAWYRKAFTGRFAVALVGLKAGSLGRAVAGCLQALSVIFCVLGLRRACAARIRMLQGRLQRRVKPASWSVVGRGGYRDARSAWCGRLPVLP